MDHKEKEQQLLSEIDGFLATPRDQWDNERAFQVLVEFQELDLDEEHVLPQTFFDFWNIVEPLQVEDDFEEPEEVFKPDFDKWLDRAVDLLDEHYGDLSAFQFKIDSGEPVDGAAAAKASYLLMEWDISEFNGEDRGTLWDYALYIHSTLDDHFDPDREIQNIRSQKRWDDLGFKAERIPLERVQLEKKEEWEARGEMLLNGWGSCYSLKDSSKPDKPDNRKYLTPTQAVAWIKAGRPQDDGSGGEVREYKRVRRPFSVIIEELYEAVIEEELDKEMDLRTELQESYRLRDQTINIRLHELLQKKALGFKPHQKKKKKRRGVKMKNVTGTDWKLPGYLPANDITLVWGPRGSGKTRLVQEMAISTMEGKGLLDRTTKAEPSKVLFCASDSGAEPLVEEFADMSYPRDHPIFDEETGLWELWCFSSEEQQSAWGSDVKGRIELFEWAKENPGALVILDSAKAVMSKGGGDYTCNAEVTDFMGFLKEAVCQFVTVVVVAHDGTRASRAGGAAAWEEIPSMVIGVKRPKDENGEESNALRVLTVHKCRKADERSFLYRKGEDGRLEPCMGAEIIGDLRSKITKWMLDRHDKGIPTASIDEIHEGVKGDGFGGTRKTIQNNLASLVRGKTPQLVRVEGKGKGIYRINPYWLRSNR